MVPEQGCSGPEVRAQGCTLEQLHGFQPNIRQEIKIWMDLTSLQSCVILNIGNGSLKNQEALFEKLQVKVSLQEDVLVWNLCTCCLTEAENLFQLKKSHVFWGGV